MHELIILFLLLPSTLLLIKLICLPALLFTTHICCIQTRQTLHVTPVLRFSFIVVSHVIIVVFLEGKSARE